MRPLVSTSVLAAVLFWATLAVWIGAAPRRRRSSGEVRRDRGTATLIVGSVGLALGLAFAAAGSVDRLAIPGPRWPVFAAGLTLMWTGAGLAIWSARTLGRFYRPVVAIQEDHEVVASGPYRYVRHPIYAGALLVMLGAGLALGNWLSLLFCVLVPLPAYLIRIRIEESALEESLGDRYRSYAQGRARLVPRVW